MKTRLPNIITQLTRMGDPSANSVQPNLQNLGFNFRRYSPENLISACAWCPVKNHKKLAKNQAYTHGICDAHKNQLIIQVKERIVQVL